MSSVLLAVSMAAVVAPISSRDPSASAANPTGRPVLTRNDWLSVVNFYRATAGSPPVSAKSSFSDGARLHSRYMIKNRTVTHFERQGNPWYTSAGSAAGRNGNVQAHTLPTLADRTLVERWMRGPFHAAGVVDPRLRRTGYGTYRNKSSRTWGVAATLDVIRGLRTDQALGTVLWPGPGTQVPLKTYGGGEYPSPISPCSGYTSGSGLPIFAMIPKGGRVGAHSFSTGSTSLAHCVYDRYTYRNRNAAEQRLARALLAARNMVILVPKAPLRDGSVYNASITAGGRTVSWSFSVGEVTPPTNPRIVGLALRPFQERVNFAVGWEATDKESGIGSYDVHVREALYGKGFGSTRTWLSNHRERGATYAGTAGSSYCFRVRARDRAGNVSGWSRYGCTTLPLSAMSLERSIGWVPAAGDYYDTTAPTTLVQDSWLRKTGVRTRSIVLVASRCQGCGTVDVYLNSTRLRRINLDGNSSRSRQILEVARFSRARSGTITIRVSSSLSNVVIEGLGLSRP